MAPVPGPQRGEPISGLGYCRIAWRLLGLVLALIICVPLHYIWRTVHYGSPIPRLFLWIAARLCGARVRVHGTHLRRDVFFIANHVSWVDILALAGASGTAFVAKAELDRAPVVGWLSRLNRTVFVSREDRMGVADQINRLKEALADNWSITVFPEGTTTDNKSLLPFKTSMLRVLEPPPPGVLVQPVVLDYGPVGEWIGWIGTESGVDNALRVLARKGSFRLNVHFLEPFDPRDHTGRKAIAAEARARILPALESALGHPVRPFAHSVPQVGFSAPKEPETGPATAQEQAAHDRAAG
ncbi:1-acyl-sn-glycerol-3-phosphate acyltransferase [Novosphingobium cyanobacteriorum]|uniref:1-acyl-sn-glycerol-3-phosphate acyltransferase n=1 Tax=Novosphingobium cyanobacteriorum TaxID=3024215 RepID=A0ABT6CHQ7_9SPHN|nr:1-acyl-sn-glycerol-3-phosphate acyltransferase [Novosphingobium cyanobacteriorum]MDF8332595.1 1-acyl-sn-glycerol-3-phosphate acyltransferase [Novosphingobium cyanobacteriorum]